MKKIKILFWASTGLIFLTQGVMELFFGHAEESIQGITHLGYPVYFVTLLVVFKIVGSTVLILPKIKAEIKEWAYAGFGIDFISAFISIWVVDGFGGELVLPVISLGVLALSYTSYHKLKTANG